MEKITYLIANYNNEKYLPECMDSILKQDCTKWECIICDDASTDNSISAIKPYLSSKIKLKENEQNIGYIKTLKKLIEVAETDIVGILDPDDALYPEATENVMSVYKKNKDAGFVYSKFHIYDENFENNIRESGLKIKPGKTSLESGFVSHIKTFRKKIYCKTKGYDERFLYCEDRDLIYKMEEVTELIFIDKPLYKYRLNNKSASNDLKNRSIMLRNHYTAVVEALNRRNIHGIERFVYILNFYFFSVYKNTKYPYPIRQMSKILGQMIKVIDNKTNIRSGGKFQR